MGIIMVTNTTASQDRPPKKYKETITTEDGEKISFEMVLIPGGSFLMGSPEGEEGRQNNEGPQHEVRLDPFYLCTTEATIKLFMAYYQETVTAKRDFDTVEQTKKDAEESRDDVDAITGPTPVYGDMTMGYGEKHPAMGMAWHNAMTVCKWLSKKTGRKYRLPTEAEWEYACRAGTTNIFGSGSDPSWLADFAWYEDNSDGETHEIGKKKPNAWGLYDMSGNVCEWVYDFYSPTAYKEAARKTPVVNPKGPKTGKVHVARGGDYSSSAEKLRCAAKVFEEEWWRSGDPQIPKSKWWLPEMDFIGFRVARSVDTGTKKSAKLVFTSNKKGEYAFDTGNLRGKLRQAGKSLGLSSVVHVPSGVRLDGRFGILSHYRVFTTNKRYGSAAWDWPSTSKLLSDGAVQIMWPKGKDRPFEMVATYRWRGSSTLDLETTVKARKDLSKFEVFLASYFRNTFPSPYVYIGGNPETEGKPSFLMARKSFGDWQMFPRSRDVLRVVHDGRWQKKPNPVKWTIMPHMLMPIGLRRSAQAGPAVVLMAPLDDCFAIATPYQGESHNSVYLSLFGRDVKAGETARARSRFVVTEAISDREILDLYQKYLK
jgi:formylglycine-generating enzyme required for sulfatase activity